MTPESDEEYGYVIDPMRSGTSPIGIFSTKLTAKIHIAEAGVAGYGHQVKLMKMKIIDESSRVSLDSYQEVIDVKDLAGEWYDEEHKSSS